MPRRRKIPGEVMMKIPTMAPPDTALELLFEGKTLEIARKVVEYLKKNKALWKDEYEEALGISGSDRILYFRVIRKMLAAGMIYEDRGTYRLSKKFAERMENLAKLWLFEIGKVEEIW
ncbi:hypothetical protein [Pyrococcus kukulkanii]|uniref:Uncharacterized protein n=1 Tax=Pyrococcus kukulkanii TaxID=1609559 RepID=A0A127B809_9EURY|nr:hypothetical protein [Pyrococcus kukulkanii]AMM53513.1 hypothetical protein TQ32_02665 [Pyrococcus kukulkanii]